MASLKEQMVPVPQAVTALKDAALPKTDVQALREGKGRENIQGGASQGELYAQIPIMPPVLLSPTGVRLPTEQTKDRGLTVRVVGAPSTAFKIDGATIRDSIFTQIAAYVENDKAITDIESLPQMIDNLIELSEQQGKKLKDIRILTHGSSGSIGMGNKTYLLSDPEVANQFYRLVPYLAEDAVISFHGCEVGKETQGLQEIANVTGVTVRASQDVQKGRPGLQGRIVEINPQDSINK
jgi:hypothetical protein